MPESVYEGCLCHEPEQAGGAFKRQAGIPVTCQGVPYAEGLRADILVDRQLIVEIKAVANIVPAHDARAPASLRMSSHCRGLLFNVGPLLLQHSLRQFVV